MVYNISTSAFGAILALIVIRLCSQELWGKMVEILLWVGMAAHILYWGNKDFLLKKFSLEPKNLHYHWQQNLYTRMWLLLAVFVIPFFLPIEFRLKLTVLVFLGARFLYQSYDVIILFKKRFLTSIVFETIAFIILVSFISIYKQRLTLNRLVLAFAGAELVKGLGIYLIFHKEFPLRFLRFDKEYLVNALPFFLLGFTGLFQSKTDLMCVTILLPKPRVAQYSVYISFLLLVQASSGFILTPFVKNIYRLKKDSIIRIANRLFFIGVIGTFIAIPTIDYILKILYRITIPRIALFSGGFFVIPVFYYSPIIYYLLKLNKQRMVVLINLTGIIAAFILNLILIPLNTNGISGATEAIAVTQWILLIIYTITGRQIFKNWYFRRNSV